MTSKAAQAMVSAEDYGKLAEEHRKLQQSYECLKRKFEEHQTYVKIATERYKAAKASCRQWLAYLEQGDHYNKSVAAVPHAGLPRITPKDATNERYVTSSQTTEDDPGGPAPGNPESDSDGEPEVVSVRSLKRRRGGSTGGMHPPVRIKLEPTSPERPIDLRSEDYSSPVSVRERPVRSETSDLDAPVIHMDTPRKGKTSRARSEEVARPSTLLPSTSSLSDGGIPGIYDDSADVKVEPTDCTASNPGVTTSNYTVEPLSSPVADGILRQRSINVPTVPHFGAAGANIKRKRKLRMAFLSEDGDEQTSQVGTPTYERKDAIAAGRRLDALLAEPSPVRQPLPKRPTPETKSIKSSVKNGPTGKDGTPSARYSVGSNLASYKRPLGLERSPPPPAPEDEPLRSRPLRRLGLDDFKINPNYLGTDYAFADTFRGREQRRCLPGCTRPECCGDIRKGFEIGVITRTKTDNEVLEEYFGPDFASIMSAYGPNKRKELIVQAHAASFANQHGKHRHAFERRSTPPGFWRIDMPTTQEEAEDRAKAVSIEREKVEERWREAMRGGRWMFRDE